MKNLKLFSGILTLMILLPANFAHAGFFGSYAEFYTVGSANSTVAQSNFTTSQQPWLYVQYYQTPPVNNPQTNFFALQSPNSTVLTATNSTNQNVNWITINPSNWNSIKTTGTWTITAASFNNDPTVQPLFGQTTFHVNAAPEPVSAVLFILGALIMGISIIRRNRTLAV